MQQVVDRAKAVCDAVETLVRGYESRISKLTKAFTETSVRLATSSITPEEAVDEIANATDAYNDLYYSMLSADKSLCLNGTDSGHEFSGLTDAVLLRGAEHLDPEDDDDAGVLTEAERIRRDTTSFVARYGDTPSNQLEEAAIAEEATLKGPNPKQFAALIRELDREELDAVRVKFLSYVDPAPAANAVATMKGPIERRGRIGGSLAVQKAMLALTTTGQRSGIDEGEFRINEAKRMGLNKIGKISLGRFLRFER